MAVLAGFIIMIVLEQRNRLVEMRAARSMRRAANRTSGSDKTSKGADAEGGTSEASAAEKQILMTEATDGEVLTAEGAEDDELSTELLVETPAMNDAEEAEQERKKAARAFARLKFRKNATDEEKKQALDEGPMIEDSSDDGRALFGLYLPDLAVILIGLCALGLILMPEVIYVKDIYGGEHYRANTMFKLTYQAFILFGMMMGYVIERCYLRGRRAGRIFSIVALVLVVFTAGYIFKSIDSWFGNVFKNNNRISTDASVFVDESMSTDFDAISWLNNKVTGRPVVLEAPGDSYTDYQRVSVATGLPTVLGWYVHEWLWRNDTDSLNARATDCQTIYTSTDEETVRQLIDKYNISYIYIGQLERQKYPDLNDSLLQSLGQVAYSDGETTYIMKISPRTS